MKKGGLVVNVGRGSLIVQPDLIQLIEEGYLSGAVLDVTDPEPLPSDNLLWGMKNVLITPHVSGISFGHTPQVEERVAKICAHNLKAFFESYRDDECSGLGKRLQKRRKICRINQSMKN